VAALTCPKCSTTWEVDQVRTGQHCPKCASWVKATPGVASTVPPATEADSTSEDEAGQEPEPAAPSGAATFPEDAQEPPVAPEPEPSTIEVPSEAQAPEPESEPAQVPTLIRADGQPTEEPVTAKPAATAEPTPLVQKQTMPKGSELPRPTKPDLSHVPPKGIAGVLQSKGIWTFHK
jgi:hypothetical protein